MKYVLLCLMPFCQNAAAGSADQKSVNFKLGSQCYEVSFEQGSSAVFSCTYPLEIEYKIKDCSSGKLIEHATNVAELSCPNDLEWKMRFRNSSRIVSTILRVKREAMGKKGMVSSYIVQSSQTE